MIINHISLSQLNSEVKLAISNTFRDNIWITAEISELNINKNGHCYLELVEIDEKSDQVIARTRATIWSYSFRMIRPYFEQTTRQNLTQGVKVLIEVSVEYHEVYGFNLNIKNIDPSYTMGDMARKRKLIIEKLKADGVYDMNKFFELPLVAQKIAIISSPTAAGLQDFTNQLNNNSELIKFETQLFPAIMQGNQTSNSIIFALDDIANYIDNFDVVVIIRGGGAQLDLASFDDYELASNIAQFPLPIITGIGHDKDETIIDLIAHTSLKTPTAVAEFLINKASNFKHNILNLELQLNNSITSLLNDYTIQLENSYKHLIRTVELKIEQEIHRFRNQQIRINAFSKNYIIKQKSRLEKSEIAINNNALGYLKSEIKHIDNMFNNITKEAFKTLKNESSKLEILEVRRNLTDPNNILKRGYSILYKEGKTIKNANELNDGDIVETKLRIGKIKSIVIKKTK